MEKKRSKGVTIFAFSLLYFPITGIIRFVIIAAFSYRVREIFVKPSYLQVAYKSPPFQLFLALVFILLIWGIFKLKKWAYPLLLVASSIFIISLSYGLIRLFKYISLGNPVDPLIIIEPAIILCYFVGLVYFFTRPKIKEQFK